MEEGTKVEGRFRGGVKWFKGTITKVNRDGTYNIEYVDGDKEIGVEPSFVRPFGSPEAESKRKISSESKEGDEGDRRRASKEAQSKRLASDEDRFTKKLVFEAVSLEMWGTEGLLPRKLIAKLTSLAETMITFSQLLRAFYDKDEDDKGIVTEDDFVHILEGFTVTITESDVELLWRCFNFQKDSKVRYWDILELILCECEGEDLPDLHAKFLKALQHKFGKSGSNKVHSELLTTFQSHDRRGRGYVPIEVFDKWLQHLGIYLEKLERKLLMQRFGGAKSRTMEYEPLIFWAASGTDWRRVKRKVVHIFPLLDSIEVNYKKIFEGVDPQGKGNVTFADFERIIRKHGLPLTNGELRMLEAEYKGRKDSVKYTELLKLVDSKATAAAASKQTDAAVTQPVISAKAAGAPKGDAAQADKVASTTKAESGPSPEAPRAAGDQLTSTFKSELLDKPGTAKWDFDIDGLARRIVATAADYTGTKDKPSLWELFRAKDKEGDGTMQEVDFFDVLQSVGLDLDHREQQVVAASYRDYREISSISYNEFVLFAYETLPNLSHLQLGPILKTVRTYLKRSTSTHEEIYDTLMDYLMAADPQSSGELPVADFSRVLARHSLGLAEEDVEVISKFFSHVTMPSEENAGNESNSNSTSNLAETTAGALSAAAMDPKSKSTMNLTGLFKTNRQQGATAAGTPTHKEGKSKSSEPVVVVNYAEFLLWLLHQAIDEDLVEWCLTVFKNIMEQRVADGISLSSAIKLSAPDTDISKVQFQHFVRRMGLMHSKVTTDLLYESLLQEGEHTLQTAKLLKRCILGKNALRMKQVEHPTKVEPSEATARLDAELQGRIKKAMEKAFKHFDVDHSNTIDVDEFGEVLRALGQDLSAKETKAILKKIGRNSEVVHYEDFERAVYPFLREKILESQKISEAILHNTFKAIDSDGGGTLSREEVKFAFVDKLKLMDEKDAEALIQALDKNKDKSVSWDEFRWTMNLTQDTSAKSAIALQRLTPEARLALKKLRLGMIPDPESYLSSFVGMPSNVRTSVLAGLEQNPRHSMEEALKPVVALQNGGLKVKDMPVQLVPITTSHIAGSKKSPECRAILQPIGTRDQQLRGESEIMQVRVSLRGATGIPVPEDDRQHDVLRRNIRACLLLENPNKKKEGHFIGNTYVSMARQDPNREERWQFLDNEYSDPNVIVRFDAKSLPGDKDAIRANMYVLFELTLTLQSDPDALTRTNKVYYHSDSDGEGRKGRKGKRLLGKKGRKEQLRKRQKSRRRKDDDDDSDYNSDDSDEGKRGSSSEEDDSDEDSDDAPRRRRSKSPSKRRRSKSRRRSSNSSEDGKSDYSDSDNGEEESKGRDKRRGRRRREEKDEGKEQEDDDKSRPKRGLSFSFFGRKKRDSGSDNDDSDSDSRGRGSSKENRRSSNLKKTAVVAKTPKTSLDDAYVPKNEVTLSCGWCKVRLLDLAQLESDRRFNMTLSGGTPFVGESIKKSEVRARRYGWRAMVQALLGVDLRSELEFVVTPMNRLGLELQDNICMLPPSILTAQSTVSLIRTYREMLAANIHRNPDNDTAVVAPGRAGAYSDPVLALFPRIMADPAMRSVLHATWLRTVKGMSSFQRADSTYYCQAFSNIVLQMWPAFSIYSARPSPFSAAEVEPLESLRERTKLIQQVTKSNVSVVPFKEQSLASLVKTTSQVFNPQLQHQPPPAVVSVFGAEDPSQLYVAFHTKEVTFLVENDY